MPPQHLSKRHLEEFEADFLDLRSDLGVPSQNMVAQCTQKRCSHTVISRDWEGVKDMEYVLFNPGVEVVFIRWGRDKIVERFQLLGHSRREAGKRIGRRLA